MTQRKKDTAKNPANSPITLFKDCVSFYMLLVLRDGRTVPHTTDSGVWYSQTIEGVMDEMAYLRELNQTGSDLMIYPLLITGGIGQTLYDVLGGLASSWPNLSELLRSR